jgi:hypothetical protein
VFECEQDLVTAFSSRANIFLRSVLKRPVPHTFILHEFNSFFGVADIVLGTYKRQVSRGDDRQPINWNWLTPVSRLRRSARVKVEDFCCMFAFTRNAGLKRLREYEQAGFIMRHDMDTFKVLREYKPVTEVVVSIEAKLRDWRRAVIQARRYSRFSDLTFVLLDGSYQKSALQNLEEFKKSNVGLVTFSAKGPELQFMPERSDQKLSEYYLRVNEAAYCYIRDLKAPALLHDSTEVNGRRYSSDQRT